MPTTTATTGDRGATVKDSLDNAAVCCEMARDNEAAGSPWAARDCYLEAEAWLMRADLMRGVDAGWVVLDARSELDRRMGIG